MPAEVLIPGEGINAIHVVDLLNSKFVRAMRKGIKDVSCLQ